MISETQNFSSMKSKIELDAVFTLFWILTSELTEQNLKWCKLRVSQPEALEGSLMSLEMFLIQNNFSQTHAVSSNSKQN